jgi:hypothetical protein
MTASWTVLVYMAADNNLSKPPKLGGPSPLDSDLQAMMAATIDPSANVIVEVVTTGGVMTRWQITHGTKTQLDVQPASVIVDTGKPEPLTDFLDWGTRAYPSANVAFVMWSHGDGVIDWGPENAAPARQPNPIFVSGVSCATGFSDTFKDYLTTADLAAALAATAYCQSGEKLGVVVFDSCLMSMVEIGYQITASASYMVGCEIELMNPGLPYTTFLSGITSALDAPGFASLVVADYAATTKPATNSTLVAINLQKFPACATAFTALVAVMTSQSKAVVAARAAVFGIYYGYFVDIQILLTALEATLAPASVTTAMAALEDAILPSPALTGPGTGGYCGLAMYYPTDPTLVKYLPVYQALAFPAATGWGKLLATLLSTSAA